MRKEQHDEMKEIPFPIGIFFAFLGVLVVMSMVHIGLLICMEMWNCNKICYILIPILYWGLVAGGLVLITRSQIRVSYEEPVKKLAKAIRKVTEGDFSVYVHPIHSVDKLNYLDDMILDFDKMVEELGSIETLKSDFVSNVSHEMKTPIAVIKNYAEMLREEELPEEKRIQYAAYIEETCIKLNCLISNILKLNKLENQTIVQRTERYDVSRQICDCIIGLQEQWEAKEIELQIEMEDITEIQADKQLMELVWNNLLTNAIKFTEKGGSIQIRETAGNVVLLVEITDSGCGMNEECIRHIFDKFYQGDPSHAAEGNGLGLALVYRVLQLVDGDIKVKSEPGKGSSFTVILPLCKE